MTELSGAPLEAAARAYPNEPACVGPSGVRTFRELSEAVDRLAGRLRGMRLDAGTRIGIRLADTERLLLVLLGLIRAGNVACPLSTRLPAGSIAPLLGSVGARTLITDVLVPDAEANGIRVLDPEELTGGAPANRMTADRMGAEPYRPATIVFTSGSTGMPKGAIHQLANHLFSAAGSNSNLPLGPGDRWLLSLPIYHVGGLGIVFRCLTAGATLVVPDPGERLDLALDRLGATHASLVATQLYRLLEAKERNLGRLRGILLGGSAMPEALIRESVRRELPVYTSYGLTEMASQVTTTPSRAGVAELLTSGRLLPHRELGIAADGEVLVRGATLCTGYATAGGVEPAAGPDGWFHTRDLGSVDEDGYLHIVGRKDNLFISGGENIQPEAIERVLVEDPRVIEAFVVPIPDQEFGARPVAFVRLVDAERSDLDAGIVRELMERLEVRLPRFMIPRSFFPMPAEANAGGIKASRRSLQQRARVLTPGIQRD